MISTREVNGGCCTHFTHTETSRKRLVSRSQSGNHRPVDLFISTCNFPAFSISSPLPLRTSAGHWRESILNGFSSSGKNMTPAEWLPFLPDSPLLAAERSPRLVSSSPCCIHPRPRRQWAVTQGAAGHPLFLLKPEPPWEPRKYYILKSGDRVSSLLPGTLPPSNRGPPEVR